MAEEVNDLELVDRARSGDKDAFRVLVERYQERVFSLALEIVKQKEDAEDIAQEAFVKAFLSLNEFRGDASFYTWVYRIAYNMAIDYRRKTARRGGEPAEFNEMENSEALLTGRVDNPHEAISRKEQGRRINQALEGISDEHRLVIMLREVDGLSYEDIARITGISLGTVMSRLHYARKRLQKALEDLNPGQSPGGGGAQEPEGEKNQERMTGNLKFFCNVTS